MMKSIEAPGFTLPGIENITRRDFLIGGTAALLFAGCGSNEVEGSSGETCEVRSGEGSIEVPVEAGRIFTTTHGWDAAVALGVEDRGGFEVFATLPPEWWRESS